MIENRVAAVFDRVSATYETVGPPFFDHFGRLLVEHAGVRPGDRVLDLASGSGAVALPALAVAGDRGSLLAVDLAPGMVDRLAGRLGELEPRDARAVVGDIADPAGLRLSADSFDVVLCGFALFFLPDPPAALAGWVRLLRTGGTLAVSTWGRVDQVFGVLRDEIGALGVDTRPQGEAYDAPAVLAAQLRAVGLASVEVTTISVDVPLADVDELLRWGATHGVRGWLDQLDADRTARLRASLTARWPGAVVMNWQAHLAVGRRA